MGRSGLALLLALGCVLFHARPAAADTLETDVNIVTAMDISDSMRPEDIRVEIDGMAQAVRSREVLEAIQRGPHGRVGFAVFAWHSGGIFPELVSWTLIASEADANRASFQLLHWLILADQAEARKRIRTRSIEGLTDTSMAINHGADLLRSAPFAASRSVVNVIGNGGDNVRQGPRAARDALIAEGGTINGVVFGGDPSVLDYFRQQVVGGPGAFLLPVYDAESVVQSFVRKLQCDIAANDSPARAALAPGRRPVLVLAEQGSANFGAQGEEISTVGRDDQMGSGSAQPF